MNYSRAILRPGTTTSLHCVPSRFSKPLPLPSSTILLHYRQPPRSTQLRATTQQVRHYVRVPPELQDYLTPEFQRMVDRIRERAEHQAALRQYTRTGKWDIEKIPWGLVWQGAMEGKRLEEQQSAQNVQNGQAPQNAEQTDPTKIDDEAQLIAWMDLAVRHNEAMAKRAWKDVRHKWTSYEYAFWYGGRLGVFLKWCVRWMARVVIVLLPFEILVRILRDKPKEVEKKKKGDEVRGDDVGDLAVVQEEI